MFWISEASYQDAKATLDALGERGDRPHRAPDAAPRLLDAETGQRGYLLTGRTEYLQPYTDALPTIRALARLAARLLRRATPSTRRADAPARRR